MGKLHHPKMNMPKLVTALVSQIPPKICTVMSMAASLQTLMISGNEKRELKTKILLRVAQLTGARETSLLVEKGEVGSLRDSDHNPLKEQAGQFS